MYYYDCISEIQLNLVIVHCRCYVNLYETQLTYNPILLASQINAINSRY